MFVHMGSVAQGEEFFSRQDPDAVAIADPQGRLCRGFGLKRGTWGQMFGPEVWACGLHAGRKGHAIGRPVGDPWQMPGFSLVEGEMIVWSYEARHAGDHPDFDRIAELIER